MDPNLLAAFLENRLTPDERRAVIRQLNESPEDYDAFAEAAGLLGELDQEPAAAPQAQPHPPAIPAQRERWWSVPRPWLLLPLAAALAAIVLVRPMLRGDAGIDDMLALATPSELVGATGPDAIATELGPDWTVTGWTVMRGSDTMSRTRSVEFRIGVRLADLELALDRRDATALQLVAGELAALLDQLPGGALVAQRFAALPRTATGAAADSARAALQALLDGSAALRLGIWTEQARLALTADNRSYFDDDAMTALRRTAANVPGSAAFVADIEAAVAADDSGALRTAVAALMREGGD